MGIGPTKTLAKLARLGVATAADLARLELEQARALMTVVGGRTVYELRGVCCLPPELVEPIRKGIAVTRSFGKPVLDWGTMREAVSNYAARAAERMRRQEAAAAHLSVFMHTSAHNGDPWYSNAATAPFMEATNDTAATVALAAQLGESIWQAGYRYAKAGIMIAELVPEGTEQRALWGEVDRERRAKLWQVMDGLNAELGRGAVRILSTGPKAAAWQLRAAYRSPRWTTRWSELPRAQAV